MQLVARRKKRAWWRWLWGDGHEDLTRVLLSITGMAGCMASELVEERRI